MEFGSQHGPYAALAPVAPHQANAELGAARGAPDRLLGEPVRVLCYPYGKQNPAVRALAREAGYEAAVIARRRLNSTATAPFRLARLRIDLGTGVRTLRWTLTHLRSLPWN